MKDGKCCDFGSCLDKLAFYQIHFDVSTTIADAREQYHLSEQLFNTFSERSVT